MKHTPAPWTVQGTTIMGPGCDQWGPIARVTANGRFDNEANAELIAEAPLMLELLEACLPYITARNEPYTQLEAEINALIMRLKGHP